MPPPSDRPTVSQIDKRLALTELAQTRHEKECAERYGDIKDMFGQIMRVLGETEDEGLRGKVADLRSVRDKGKGVWFAIAAGCGVVATIGGWLISFLT